MGGVYQRLGGGAKPHDDFIRGFVGLSPLMHGMFQYLNTLAFASNYSSGRVIYFIILCLATPNELDHPLFSPP